jgi:hypothetical protein
MKREEVHESLIQELRQLSQVAPPTNLVAKVMQEVERPAPFRLWTWLCRPRALELRLSPLASLVAVALVGVGVWAVRERGAAPLVTSAPTTAPVAAAPSDADVVLVRFVLATQGARTVAIAGDFNGWDPQATPLQMQPQNDVFAVTLPLRKGQTYQYMFWVDGQWVADPSAELRPDGFGQQNSLLRL